MRIVMGEEKKLMTEYGRYVLQYELTEHCSDTQESFDRYYGIRIVQKREREAAVFDECVLKGITESVVEAKALFESLVDGLVMPVSLCEIVDDWQSVKEGFAV